MLAWNQTGVDKNRWSQRGVWRMPLAVVAAQGPVRDWAISTPPTSRRIARHGAKGAPRRKQSGARGGQTTKVHAVCDLLGRPVALKPVIPGRINRKCRIRHDRRRHKERWRIEAMFCRLKDFRRVATLCDKLTSCP